MKTTRNTDRDYTTKDRRLKPGSPIKKYIQEHNPKDPCTEVTSTHELSQKVTDILYIQGKHDKDNPTIFHLDTKTTRDIFQCHLVHRDQIPEKIDHHLASKEAHFYLKYTPPATHLLPLGFHIKPHPYDTKPAPPWMRRHFTDPRMKVKVTADLLFLIPAETRGYRAGQMISFETTLASITTKLSTEKSKYPTDPNNTDIWYLRNSRLGDMLQQSVLHKRQLRHCLQTYFKSQEDLDPDARYMDGNNKE